MDANETRIYHAIVISGCVIGSIIIYFVISTFRNQRKRIRLQRLHFLNEIQLLEKERARLSRDLHDELGPLLSLIKQQLQSLPKEMEQHHNIEKANQHIHVLASRLGEIAINLVPSALANKGLEFALKEFCENLEDTRQLKVMFKYDIRNEPNENIAIHIFRIMQEIGHNTLKHSKASLLTLHLKEFQQQIFIATEDNGIGFCEEEIEEGLGLKSLRSRTGMLGGKINCYTGENKGTKYFIEIPI